MTGMSEEFFRIPEVASEPDTIRSLQTEVAYLRKELEEEKLSTAELSNRINSMSDEMRIIAQVLKRCCDLATTTEHKVKMWPFVPSK